MNALVMRNNSTDANVGGQKGGDDMMINTDEKRNNININND
jgi:hypothetical protein